LPLGVKCEIAVVAEELPPRDSPFAALRRDRRFRFSLWPTPEDAISGSISFSTV